MSTVLPEPSSYPDSSDIGPDGTIDAELLASQAIDQPSDEELVDEDSSDRSFLMFNAMPAGMISMVLHIILVLVLGMVSLSQPEVKQTTLISAPNTKDDVAEVEEFEITEILEPV